MNERITSLLIDRGQEHLLQYMDTLAPADRLAMERQLAQLDYSIFDEQRTRPARGVLTPMHAGKISEADKARCREIGLQALREGKLGCVLLAGGQGSRFCYDRPKGTFNIGITRKLCIFECLIRNLLDVTEEAGCIIPLFIMTSQQNDAETRAFLREHAFFGYDPNAVSFFVQEQLPTLDENGKLMLSDRSTVCTAPNGNGGWYNSMANNGLLELVDGLGLEWLNVFAVDNVLQRMADPCFLGAVIDSGSASGAKFVAKNAPDEKVGVLCFEDGRPSIVEYFDMTQEMREAREPDGSLSYRCGVILNYLFRTDCLNASSDIRMPLHRAFKKIPYMTFDGAYIEPDAPNAYKMETLALDMVRLMDSCLPYEVEREREFAPVKNRTGVDSAETARELLRRNGVEL